MKIRHFYLLIILLTILTSCSKENEDCENPIDCLPPATQSGANTVGCLVDGKVLKPAGKGFGTGSILKAQYSTFQGKTLFGISVNDFSSKNNTRALSLLILSETIQEGKIYELEAESDSTDSAIFYEQSRSSYKTNQNKVGEMYFSKVDFSKRIASGTFWFDAQNNDGEIVEIREGRFDVIFY